MNDYASASDEPEAGPKKQKNGLTAAEEKAVLEEARARMKRALDADSKDRKRAQLEQKFVWNTDNCQWDDEAKKARKSRPMLTENRNPSFVRQATNEVRRSRPQIRVLPVDNQGDPLTAEVIEGLIRNIEANSRADMAYDGATDTAAYCGRGYWKVTTEYQGDGFDQDITIQPVPDPFSIVDDPDTAYPDKSDRKFAFEVEKVARSEYKAQTGVDPKTWADAQTALGEYADQWCDAEHIYVANYWRVITEKEIIFQMTDGQVVKDADDYIEQATAAAMQQMQQQMQMQPPGMPPPDMQAAMAQLQQNLPAVKQQRELITRKVEWYCIDGMNAHSKGEWAGQYVPLVYVTCEQMKVDGKWQTKGMTYDSQDLTKANNYLLSAQIENIALTPKVPFVGAKGSFVSDKAKWNSINTAAHAYVEYDLVDADGKPLPPPSRSMGVTGQPEIATVRMGVIDGQRSVVGLMGASLGDSGPEVAWRAIESRQAKGDTAVFHVMDNVVRAVRYCGMVIVDLIPKVYDGPRVVRIINPDSQPLMQTINKAFPDPNTGEPQLINLTTGKYDITVSAGPAFETQRQQDNARLVDLSGKIPQLGVVAPDLITKALMPGGDGQKIADRLLKSLDPSITGQGPSQNEQKLQQQVQGMQQQLTQTTQEKDYAMSELAKQKGLVESSQIKNQTAGIEQQRKLAELQTELATAQLEVQKKDLEVQKAQLALIRASMPAPVHPAAPAPMQ